MCSLFRVLSQLQITRMQEYRLSRKKTKTRKPLLDYLGSPCKGLGVGCMPPLAFEKRELQHIVILAAPMTNLTKAPLFYKAK